MVFAEVPVGVLRTRRAGPATALALVGGCLLGAHHKQHGAGQGPQASALSVG